MTRREAAALALAGSWTHTSGQSPFGSMLWNFVREYLRKLDGHRAGQLAKLASEQDFLALRERVRTGMAQMWGGFPERTPLNPRIVGTVDRDDHRIERILFESRPSFHVSANLYRPAGSTAPGPAIVFPCGHSAEGKVAAPYQRFCRLMARNGFMVLTWDPVSQGERVQFLNSETGQSEFGSGTGEHRILGDRCYLVGENLMQYRAWDVTRALDYLELRPEIDPERIGLAGQSGGGMTALQFACFDDRIRAAFISCAVASFRAKAEALLIADPEQVLYGTLREGIDHPELLAAFAPKPLAIGAALQDYVPIDGVRSTYRELQAVYAKLGYPENLQLCETDAPHSLNRELREAGARFFLRALCGKEADVREDQDPLPSAKELLCSNSGHVAESGGSRSVVHLYAQKANRIAPHFEAPRSESEFDVYQSEIASRIRKITRVGAYKAEWGIEVPTRFLDAGVYAKGTVFLVAEQGKDHPIVQRYCIDAVVAANHSIYGLDVRGWGATKPRMPALDVCFDWDDFLAYRSLEIGRPLFGQRLKDLLATAPTLTRRRRWIVIGIGIGGLLVTHAAVLDPRVAGVISIQAPLSYRAILEDPRATQPVSCLLPGVLSSYEIKDLYASVAPRPLLIVNPVDARGSAMDPERARADIAWTFNTYRTLEAGDAIRVESQLGLAEIRSLIGEWLRGAST